MAAERLQKLLAAAGFGARRACEDLILDGKVRVNGRLVNRLPVLVDPRQDRIVVRGKPVRVEKRVYFLLNKPQHVYCTHSDPAGRRRAVDLLGDVRERVFPVGRLDADSMGLLIMTNDGELAQKLTHPSFNVPKTYRAEVVGVPSAETLARLRDGIWLSDGRTSGARVTIIHHQRTKAVLEITLREGRNRQVRRMLANLGHKVRRLTRIRMGKLSISRLPLGAFRPLKPAEVKYLYQLAEQHSGQRSASSGADAVSPKRVRPRVRRAAPATQEQAARSRADGGKRSRRRPDSAATRRPPAKGRRKSKAPAGKSGRRIILPQ